ncbi:DUF2066 domain-containing protein [Woodsholea maritima]|uniref:DUF2066 domain-containing protein n=1 Tax=Woodsholea maritima TaxID=240237 RepID=UPI000379640D|nr:DUF2066 domain-containing protein [Woodsholea maritima]
MIRFQGVVTALITSVALLGAMAAPSLAQAGNPFAVSGVRIDARAETATAAQTAAMAEGQRQAAERLIERLTLAEDRMMADLPPLDRASAASMVAGLQIANEQRSATRYIADLSVNFDRRAVSAYLNNNRLPFVEAQARPTLVIPVLQRDGAAYVWAGPWFDVWQRMNFANALTPVRTLGRQVSEDQAPLGRALLTNEAAMRGDEGVLREVARLYGVDQIALLVARESEGYVRVAGQILTFSADPEIPPQRESMGDLAGPGGYDEAAKRFVAAREHAWKEASIVRDLSESEMEVSVLFTSLTQWRDLQTAIAGASLVRDARLDAISRDGAVMTLTYRGARGQLESVLRERGAVLSEEGDLGWTVRARN